MGAATTVAMTSCHNSDLDFPDFDYSAVYFPYQTPVRTIVLGEDTYDTTNDNAHQCEVYATLSGLYENTKNVVVDIEVDNSLCDNLTFTDDEQTAVKPLPSSYYNLTADQISLNKTLSAGVLVKLTDAFFADPDAIKTTYVLPLKMTEVSGADSILMGTAVATYPIATKEDDWSVAPKHYVLYALKYINPWHAYYLRRGEDKITEDGTTTTALRHEEYVEYDEVVSMSTVSMTETLYPVTLSIAQADGSANDVREFNLDLIFDGDDITVESSSSNVLSASGSGKYVVDGELKSWGNEDRNAIYLSYQVTLDDGIKVETTDTLVVRNRGVTLETFSYTYNE